MANPPCRAARRGWINGASMGVWRGSGSQSRCGCYPLLSGLPTEVTCVHLSSLHPRLTLVKPFLLGVALMEHVHMLLENRTA